MRCCSQLTPQLTPQLTRTFVALERNEALQRYLEGFMRRLATELPRLSWVNPAGIHLTLAFLGELSYAELVQATYAAKQAAQNVACFEYRLSHLAIFGIPRQPRVLWVGIEELTGGLQKLQRTLIHELRQRNFTVGTRPFSPHLTLARCKLSLRVEEQERLQRILHARQFSVSPALYYARRISVMKSELARSGATYTSLQDYPLTKA